MLNPGRSTSLPGDGATVPGFFPAYLAPDEARRRALRHLAWLAAGGRELLSLSPRLFLFDQGDEPALQMEAAVRDARGAVETRPLLVRHGAASGAATGVSEDSAGAGGLVGYDDEADVTLWLSPADPTLRFPGELTRESWLIDLARALRGRDAEPSGDGRLRIVGHRFGRRLTLHARCAFTTAGGSAATPLDLIVKLCARGRDAALAHTLRTLRARRAGLPFQVPEVLHHDPARGLLVLAMIPGRPLHDCLGETGPEVFPAVGRAIRALDSETGDGLPAVTTLDEHMVLWKIRTQVSRLSPALGELMLRSEEAMRGTVPRDGDPLVLSHRDLHDKQILVDGDGIGIIDWELAARAPRGLDAGNFLAHLRLRGFQGLLDPDEASRARAGVLGGFAPAGTTADDAAEARRRLDFHERLALIRLGGVYALRPGKADLAARLLAEAGRPAGEAPRTEPSRP